MGLTFTSEINREDVFDILEEYLLEKDFNIVNKNPDRPWGGFFIIKESQADDFIKTFFSDLNKDALHPGLRLSPKVLIVGPGKRLSWQYHFRRSELWKIIGGNVGVSKSDTDEETEMKIYTPDDTIKLATGERHRLIGLHTWGIVAEIWQHSDNSNPSDEDDIVRLQDDFGR